MLEVLVFLSGLLLGNWLAIGRDKRREFNDVVAPIRVWLLAEIAAPSPHRPHPSDVAFHKFLSALWPWQRRTVQELLTREREFRVACTVRDAAGGVSYANEAVLINELKRLLKYAKYR